MKKAFTLIELIFVIVVIGIIASLTLPNLNKNNLSKAAMQVASHIRYTQHLAMMDDKFDINDPNWFQERWTIRFKQDLVYSLLSPAGTYNDVWTYNIFGDKSHDGNPNLSEMAINPLNRNQYLSGGYNDTLHIEDKKSMRIMRLGESYGIKDVKFSGGCRSNITYIYFDNLGRPFNSMNTEKPYESASSGWHKLLSSECKISLCSEMCTGTTSDSERIITIQPETGYVYIE